MHLGLTALLSGAGVCKAAELFHYRLTVRGDGVLGAGRRGGLGAVAAGAVQGVPAAARRVRVQTLPKSQGQLLTGRVRLHGNTEQTGHGGKMGH